MNPAEPVEFAMQGVVNGVEISPHHVPFSLMRKFHDEVERLIFGSNDGTLGETIVEVKQGSYGLVVPLPEPVRESFELDLAVVADVDSPSTPDPVRLAILQSWQRRASAEKTIGFAIRPRSPSARFEALRIDAQSTLRRPKEDRWIKVELMLLGTVLEAGGQKANIHVRLRDQPKLVIVAVDREQLEREPYPFTGEKLLRVSAVRNERTKVLDKLRLIEFVPYRPEFDEKAFSRMTAAGASAWADVPDASTWVREQRGG